MSATLIAEGQLKLIRRLKREPRACGIRFTPPDNAAVFVSAWDHFRPDEASNEPGHVGCTLNSVQNSEAQFQRKRINISPAA